MKNNIKKTITPLKLFLIIIFVLIIISGLFGALCGGFFTIMFIFDGGGYDFYIISVPSLIIGLLLILGGYFGIKKIRKNSLKKNIERKNIIDDREL